MAIIRAMVAGERHPQKLAALKHRRIQSSADEIAKALTGDYRAEHLFVLQQELALYDIHQQQVAECARRRRGFADRQIEQCLANFPAQTEDSPPPRIGKRRKKPLGNEPDFDLHRHLYRITGVDFTAIDGLNVLTVQTIISEVGLDPTRFPTVKHFTSWLGLCPGSRITGGKVKSSQTRKVVNRAANAFRVAAQSLSRSRSALGAFSRRLRARLGAPKAITAAAHKLARMFYRLWTTRQAYCDPGADYYEQKYRERMVNNLKKKARSINSMLKSPYLTSPSIRMLG